MTINNLGDHVEGALIAGLQEKVHVRSNGLDNLLSDASQKPLGITISDAAGSPTDADRTLTDDEFFGDLLFKLSGSPTIDFQLLLPASGNHLFVVKNDTGQKATVKAAGGSATVEIEDAITKILHSDGTDVFEVGRGGSPYDVGGFIPTVGGEAQDGTVAFQTGVVRSFTLPVNAAGSEARASTAMAGGEPDIVFDVQRNGSSIGSLTFVAGSDAGTFSISPAVAFAAGDLLQVVHPSFGSPTLITTLSNVSVTFLLEL